jgi:hypothetical protein
LLDRVLRRHFEFVERGLPVRLQLDLQRGADVLRQHFGQQRARTARGTRSATIWFGASR